MATSGVNLGGRDGCLPTQRFAPLATQRVPSLVLFCYTIFGRTTQKFFVPILTNLEGERVPKMRNFLGAKETQYFFKKRPKTAFNLLCGSYNFVIIMFVCCLECSKKSSNGLNQKFHSGWVNSNLPIASTWKTRIIMEPFLKRKRCDATPPQSHKETSGKWTIVIKISTQKFLITSVENSVSSQLKSYKLLPFYLWYSSRVGAQLV